MITKIAQTIEQHNMLDFGGKVTVALSGGADSTALLLALRELGYKVSCVHVNHNLRGEEALRDQSFCENLCERLGVPLAVESVDVRSYADEHKLSTEEAARNLRYDAISKHASGKVATAHNLNDCFETTLFNLTRGTSLGGILGIPPTRDNIIRPLINCTKQEIIDYLNSKNQPWVEDSTNQIADCTRNTIRLEIVPRLLEINSGLYKSYQSFLDTVGEAKEYIDSQVTGEYNKNLSDGRLNIMNIPEGTLRSNAVSMYLKSKGVSPTHDMVTLILRSCDRDTRINLKKGVYARLRLGTLSVERDADRPLPICGLNLLSKSFEFGQKTVKIINLSQFDISYFNKNDLKYAVDLDKLHGKIIARSSFGNETIRLVGRGFTSVVKKLFAQVAEPADRPFLMVLADDRGVFFAEGFGIDERVMCDESTTRAAKIDIK